MPTKHLLYVPKRTDKMKYLQGNSDAALITSIDDEFFVLREIDVQRLEMRNEKNILKSS